MAIYFPRQHLALEVVDDPCSAPVDRDAFPDLTVVPITCAEIGAAGTGGQADGAAGSAVSPEDAAARRRLFRLIERSGLTAGAGPAAEGELERA